MNGCVFMARGPTISTTFRAIDRATAPMKRMMRTAGRIAAVGGAAIGGGLALAAREFADFDQSITTAAAKFGSIDLATSAGRDAMDRLGGTAREVGATTQFSAAEAAEGLDYLAMAGFSAEQAAASLSGVAALATAANLDLGRATDIASDSLGIFNLMSADTATLMSNQARLNDVLVATSTKTNTTFEALFETAVAGGAAFTAAGQSVETFNALAGVLANNGIKASQSGTMLRNIVQRLASPTAGAAKALSKLGLTVEDDAGNFRDFLDIVADLSSGLNGMGDVARAETLGEIFGVRNLAAIEKLLQAGPDGIRALRGELLDAAGTTDRLANAIGGTLINKLKSLRSAAVEKGFQAIERFADQAAGGIDNLIERVRNFDIAPIMDRVVAVVDRVSAAWRSGLIPAILAGVATFKILLPILTTGAALIKAVKIAQIGLNAAFANNPLGIVLTAVSALVGGIVLLIKNWERISTAVTGFFDRIRGAFSAERQQAARDKALGKNNPSLISRNEAAMSRSVHESRQTVDINLPNLPEGTTVRERGRAPNVTLYYGAVR